MINYGSGGIGSEIIANRLGVGPMWDCLTCSYEEFFLASSAVGDPAMLVDVPANVGLENCDIGLDPNACAAVGPKATKAFYPDDPANVHHSYQNDRVVFRNVHAGKEHHIFHLHNHQWLFDPNDDNANVIDAQAVGPGSGYTYEINWGGAGNRHKSVGDAIYHCHFYPHFAQGMWKLWRIHDVYETGPEWDESLAKDEEVELVVQINGKLRAKVLVPSGLSDDEVRARALSDRKIQDSLSGKEIRKVVVVKGRLVNVVVQ